MQTGFQLGPVSLSFCWPFSSTSQYNLWKCMQKENITKHKNTPTSCKQHSLWWQCFKGTTNKLYNNSWDILVIMAVLVVLRLCIYLFFLALMAWFVYWFSLSSFFIGTSLLHEQTCPLFLGNIPQPKTVCTARFSRLFLRDI